MSQEKFSVEKVEGTDTVDVFIRNNTDEILELASGSNNDSSSTGNYKITLRPHERKQVYGVKLWPKGL